MTSMSSWTSTASATRFPIVPYPLIATLADMLVPWGREPFPRINRLGTHFGFVPPPRRMECRDHAWAESCGDANGSSAPLCSPLPLLGPTARLAVVGATPGLPPAFLRDGCDSP